MFIVTQKSYTLGTNLLNCYVNKAITDINTLNHAPTNNEFFHFTQHRKSGSHSIKSILISMSARYI